jgi:hypothetical protein
MNGHLLIERAMLGRAGWAFFLAAFLAAAPASRAGDILPKAFPASRYEKLGAHSPFAPPTVVVAGPAPVIAPTTSWSDKLAITLLTQQGGKYVATVLDRDSSQHFLVDSEQENERHMMLSSVQWADAPNQTRVTIRRGTEFGQVSFDPSASANISAPSIPGARGAMGAISRPPMPSSATFHPPPGGLNGARSPSVIRRPTIPATPPTLAPRTFPGNGVVQQPADDDDDDDN